MGELHWHKGSMLLASSRAKQGPAPRHRQGTRSCVLLSLTYSKTFTMVLERSQTAAVTRDTKVQRSLHIPKRDRRWILFGRGMLRVRGRRGLRMVLWDTPGDKGCQREEDFQKWATTARQEGPRPASPHQQVGTDHRTALELLPHSL